MLNVTVCMAGLLVGWPVQATPIEVRVALVGYEDFHAELADFERIFAELARREPRFRFRLAVGSYGEVAHWMDRRLADIAIVTPGVATRLLSLDGPGGASRHCRYLATVRLPAAVSDFAAPTRRQPGFHDLYGSVCLVPAESSLQSVADLRKAARENRLQFVFVHPLSVSGRAAPLAALRSVGISPRSGNVRFSYSHTESLRALRAADASRERVAFVWDDAAGKDRGLQAGVRRLPFPELESLRIPHDVVLAQAEYEHADQLRELLLQYVDDDQPYGFARLDDWPARYGTVRDWLQAAGVDAALENGERASLEEISRLLLLYARSQPRPPRLAVVLSGGGAKCSYQVGAVAALEDELAKVRDESGAAEIDIGLVVGTSGGAINALPVALGVSRTGTGQQAFGDVWRQLDQREIVRPSLLVRANMGLWFALLQTAVVIWIVRRFVADPEKRAQRFALIYTALAAIEILVGYLPGSPWHWLGTNHVAHHVWLWFSFGVRTAAWTLLVIGVAAMGLEIARNRRGRHLTIPRWLTRTTILGGLLGLPLVQLVTILYVEETLSSGAGMESALARRFPQLINQHLAETGQPPLATDTSDNAAARLRAVSRQLLERRYLVRDLVITGSCLSQTSETLPSDLYFYAPAAASPAPPFGERGIALHDYPDMLLDVMMGSGSIFPMFPPRRIVDFPVAGEQIELVDGGFAHNSPVEAAVLWGATHIVLIEATPRTRSERGNFIKNAASSFRHLHRQAQLLDARSRGRVVVFSLAPEPPHMCVLDFASNLIDASIRRGRRDAARLPARNNLRFRKELGQPDYVNVTPAPRGPDGPASTR